MMQVTIADVVALILQGKACRYLYRVSPYFEQPCSNPLRYWVNTGTTQWPRLELCCERHRAKSTLKWQQIPRADQ